MTLGTDLRSITPPPLQCGGGRAQGGLKVGFINIGLIWVKEEGRTGFSEGWQGCSEGFPKGEARGKSRGAVLPAREKPRPSQLFYWDFHSISNKIFQSTEVSRRVNFFKRYFSSLLMTNCKFWHNFLSLNFLCRIFFDKIFCCRNPVKSFKTALKDCDEFCSKSSVEYHI